MKKLAHYTRRKKSCKFQKLRLLRRFEPLGSRVGEVDAVTLAFRTYCNEGDALYKTY